MEDQGFGKRVYMHIYYLNTSNFAKARQKDLIQCLGPSDGFPLKHLVKETQIKCFLCFCVSCGRLSNR